jgi:hypothetical protein
VGSPQLGQWIAGIAFPTLLILGYISDELRPKWIAAFAVLGVAAWIGLPRLPPSGSYLVSPVLGILDIVLVLMVFKRDIRIG